MSEVRLTSAMLVSALVRRANREGGFAAVIAKGDATSGAILVQLREKDSITGLYERVLQASGGYEWARSGPQSVDNIEELSDYLTRRHNRDPDLWLVELDIADGERFIVGMTGIS